MSKQMQRLFSKTDIFQVMEYQKQELKEAFNTVTNADLLQDTRGVISSLVEQFCINVPVLDDANKYALTKETQVDVSQDRMRFISDRSRPLYVGGTEITFVLPFTGDAALFEVRPTAFTLNPPYGEVQKGELHLIYKVANAQFNVQ